MKGFVAGTKVPALGLHLEGISLCCNGPGVRDFPDKIVKPALELLKDVLQWLRSEGCPWDSNTCYKAAEKGHLSVLQWARSEGCPWNLDVYYAAAEDGHISVMQWARNNGCHWDKESFC